MGGSWGQRTKNTSETETLDTRCHVPARKVLAHRRMALRAATFRFSGGSPPEQVPFALVSVLRAGPFGPSGAAGLKVWPDFGRMDQSPRRPLGYELTGGGFTAIPTSQTCTSAPLVRLCHYGAFQVIMSWRRISFTSLVTDSQNIAASANPMLAPSGHHLTSCP